MKDDPARPRFLAIQAARWSGVALFVIGTLILYGHLELPAPAGYALAAAGLFNALVLPTLLARRWKSPPP